LLLFFLAHPHSENFSRKTDLACRHISQLIAHSNLRLHPDLISEGLPGATITTQYSLSLLYWLNDLAPHLIQIESIGADEATQQEIIAQILPQAEREYFESSDEPTVSDWMKKYTQKSNPLHALLDLFAASGLDEKIKTYLFEKLDIFVQLELASPVIPRSLTRGINRPIFLHTEPFIRSADVKDLIREPLAPTTQLSAEEIEHLIHHKRFHLAALGRETDPGTYADSRDVQLLDMGRGMHIALYGMDPDHRLPLDAYIGFMAFKNNIPYAYGGAWMMGDNAKIGINIFPPFRGGESAWFFAQLMRAYHQSYGPVAFQAESYQLGKDNPEGLESGAFWFYYRLGFRPQKKELRKLADTEWKKIAANKSYRTSLKTLARLVDDEVALQIEPTGMFSTRMASRSTSVCIRNVHSGNRSEALEYVRHTFSPKNGFVVPKGMSDTEKSRWENWLLFLLPIQDITSWNDQDKRQILELAGHKIRGKDSDYATNLNWLLAKLNS